MLLLVIIFSLLSFQIIVNMDLSAQAVTTKAAWTEICEDFAVPKILFQHQIDTISLLLGGENVFCGSPTGSGKTLPQLATVLFTSGYNINVLEIILTNWF